MYTILGIIILYYCFQFVRKLIGKTTPNSSAQPDPLADLVHLLFDNGQSIIVENIQQLKDSSSLFIKNNQRIFEPYGIEEAEDATFEESFKVLLAYHLRQGQNFLTLDWKESGFDGLASINWLLENNGVAAIAVTEKDRTKRAIPKKYLTEGSPYYLKADELLIFVAAI